LTPLHYAAIEGKEDIIEYLIQRGVNTNDCCDNGFFRIFFQRLSILPHKMGGLKQ